MLYATLEIKQLELNEIKRLVISAYDHIAGFYTDAYADNDDQDAKYLDEFIIRLSGNKVLDMGCGSGTNTAYLQKKGLKVIGIDASSSMLSTARRLYQTIQFEEQDILNTSFSKNAFDGIVLAYVINHLNKKGLALLRAEIDRILRKDGLLFVSAHVGDTESIIPDPLDASIKIYYNFLNSNVLDELFYGYRREFYFLRQSYGAEELLCDKLFVVYKNEGSIG